MTLIGNVFTPLMAKVGRQALDRDLDFAGLHLRADVGADARQGHEGAELHFLLGESRPGSR